MTLQCLVTYRELPIDRALSRMSLLSSFMCDDAVQSLLTLDKKAALEVIARDDEVDRLYFFVVRQLKRASEDGTILRDLGLSSPRECLSYRMVAKALERAADHGARIAQTTLNMNKPIDNFVRKQILNLKDSALTTFKKSIKLLLNKFDFEKANSLIEDLKSIKALEDKIIKSMVNSSIDAASLIELRMVVESIRRMAEYGSDIAELAMNLNVNHHHLLL